MNKMRRWVLGVFAAIALTLVGNALYEFIAKPGMYRLSRTFLSIVTLGSEKIRDSAYESAALDPSSLPVLLFMFLLSLIPMWMAQKLLAHEFLEPIIENKVEQQVKKVAVESKDNLRTYLSSQLRKARIILVCIYTVVFVFSYATYNVVNQSVLIYRVFKANVAICGPYISQAQEKLIQGKFASMKSKNDYMAIDNELRKIAADNNVKLIDADLW